MEPARLIATALPEELGAIRRRMRDVRRLGSGYEGRLGGRPVWLACTGSGPRRAERGLDRLLSERPVALVIAAGIAGALTAQLGRGDVVVARGAGEAAGEAPGSDEVWRERAVRLGAREVVALSVDRIVTRPAGRLALARGLPADTAATVDMESAAWTRVARRRGARCLVLRVISDDSGEVLPDYLTACLDAAGGVSRWRIAAAALVHPRSLGTLLRLRRHARAAAERLAAFAEELLSGDRE